MPPSSQEELFERAVGLPPAERQAWLMAACADDQSMRRRLESLLRAHDEAQGFMESPPPDLGPAKPEFSIIAEERPGDRIGRYKILQKIGEGGCGIVYMAEQEEAVRRRVALKVIKLGMDTKAVIARFEAERQALARMEHPNIARVLDAGATDSGRPFFVMELVRGLRITEYCDQNNLSTEQRLQLFMKVCQAIQHAHQKGIIHRDIKPSNILVTLHDGEPVPKVIDFGIAKATQGRLTEQTLFTAFEQFIGTPAYVSPEQAEMSGLDVDTRSDIYSLGVLLYELLAGRTPFDTKELIQAGLDEMRRVIREQEPPRPSIRLRTLNDSDRTTVARRRGTDAPRLSLRLRGDLDWIVMRCLEKDRSRRYETASALANDIQRHLENEPVSARPPSTTYLVAKLIRRHKFGFFASTTVVATLVLGFVVSTRAFLSAQRNLERALQAEQKAARALATALEQKAAAERAKDAEARLRAEAQAGELKAQTESARRAHVADFTTKMISELGELLTTVDGDTKVIQQILKQTTTRLKLEAQHQPDLPEMVGRVYYSIGDFANGELLMRDALAMRRALPNTEPMDLANTLNYLGLILSNQDKLDEAEQCQRDALDILQRSGNAGSERLIAQFRANLGAVLGRQGRFAEASTLINDALFHQRDVGPESIDVAISTRLLGVVQMQEGRLEESEATLLEALRLIRKNLGTEHSEVVSTYFSLAITFGSQFLNHPEKIRDALAAFREAETIRQRLKNPGAIPVARPSAASVFEAQGSYAEVEIGLKEMRRFMQRSYPAGSWDDAYFLAMTGYVQLQMRKWVEAETTARECYAIRVKLRPDDWCTFHAKNMIGRALAGQKKFAEAEPLLIEGYRGMKQQEANIPPFHQVRLAEGIQRIIECYQEWGKTDDVAKWQVELTRLRETKTSAAN